MAPSTVGIILLIYRGQIRQFTTAADALQCVRRETITTTWFARARWTSTLSRTREPVRPGTCAGSKRSCSRFLSRSTARRPCHLPRGDMVRIRVERCHKPGNNNKNNMLQSRSSVSITTRKVRG